MHRLVTASVVVGLAGGAATAWALLAEPGAATIPEPLTPVPSLANTARGITFLAAAGGGTPEFNQVSIEQDLGLVQRILVGPSVTLFAAGPIAPVVQELDPAARVDPVTAALADLFAPRGGRTAKYRPPDIDVDGPATAASVRDALASAISEPGDPLIVYLAGHGLGAEDPRDNTIGFWEQSSLSALELAAVFDNGRRSAVMVMTSCFAGGFAEVLFEHGEPTAGAATPVRCGLFATTWDLEASGCDPDPDRSAQQGYGLHFLHALVGKDRDGNRLATSATDFDNDGQISLLEAHTRVRLASAAADVPTTTSERWLREITPPLGSVASVDLPEETAVIEKLAPELGVSGREAAQTRLGELERALEAAATELNAAQAAEDEAYRATAAELLARWPVLDDPWHPRFAAMLESAHDELRRYFESSPTYARYLDARAKIDELVLGQADTRRRAAPYERLARAYENLELAGRLRGQGGDSWTTFERLRACERTVPRIHGRSPGPPSR